MDIPAPQTPDEEHKVAVRTVPTEKTVPEPAKVAATQTTNDSTDSSNKTDQVTTKSDIKDEAFTAEEQRRKNLAEMITEKRFFLPIKEKRQSAALTLVVLPKKAKKPKKTAPKKAEGAPNKSGSSHQTMLIIILVVVLVGTVFAIDAGMIDIGIKLPFDLIKNV